LAVATDKKFDAAFNRLLNDMVGQAAAQQMAAQPPPPVNAVRQSAPLQMGPARGLPPVSARSAALIAQIIQNKTPSRTGGPIGGGGIGAQTMTIPSRADLIQQSQSVAQQQVATPPPAQMPADVAAGHNLPTTDTSVISQMYGDTRNPLDTGAGSTGANATLLTALDTYIANGDYTILPPGSDYTVDEWNGMGVDQKKAYTAYMRSAISDQVQMGETSATAQNVNPDAITTGDLVPQVVKDAASLAGRGAEKVAGKAWGVPLPSLSMPTPGGVGGGGSKETSAPTTVGQLASATGDAAIRMASYPKQKQDELFAQAAIYMATHNGDLPPALAWMKDLHLVNPQIAQDPTNPNLLNPAAAGHPMSSPATNISENTNIFDYVANNPETWPELQIVMHNAEIAGTDPEKAALAWFHANQSGIGAIVDQVALDPLNYMLALGIPAKILLDLGEAGRARAAINAEKAYKDARAAGATEEEANLAWRQSVQSAGQGYTRAGTALKFASDPLSGTIEHIWGRGGELARAAMGGEGRASERQAANEAYSTGADIIRSGEGSEEVANRARQTVADQNLAREQEAAAKAAKDAEDSANTDTIRKDKRTAGVKRDVEYVRKDYEADRNLYLEEPNAKIRDRKIRELETRTDKKTQQTRCQARDDPRGGGGSA
jgi:hypothetical protein